MSISFRSSPLAEFMLTQIEQTFFSGGTCEFRTGPPPANPSDPDAGVLLAVFTLDAPGFDTPNGNSIALAGTAKFTTAISTGVVGHMRFKDATFAVGQIDVEVGPAIPILDTDHVTSEFETAVAHGYVDNQAVYLYEGTSYSGPAYVIVVDATHIQLALTPGGSAIPAPPSGTYTNAYFRDARYMASINSVTGDVTLGDTVILPEFGISI